MNQEELQNEKNYKSWPFTEALRLANKEKDVILFETGYGPSGLPHIGTFGENLRTTFVRKAFEHLFPNKKTRMIAFSDDMDGFRKVPDNVPNKEMLALHLNKSLTSVPDPFECHKSFGEHNNNQLQLFLNRFNFEYDFLSSTELYQSGFFDDALIKVLENYEEILSIMLPSLREERSLTYSPFLPIHPVSGEVMQVAIDKYDLDAKTVIFKDRDGKFVEVPVTGGNCKLQWKVDWAMRWYALRVDYEMHGKDLIDSVKLSRKICKVLGYEGPETFVYELFCDDEGKKISKSKGNGLSLDEWLDFAPNESIANYMFQSPKSSKKLSFNVIPRQIDDYLAHWDNYMKNPSCDNPVWHINFGHVPEKKFDISFNILLNLASACNPENSEILWGFLNKYEPNMERSGMIKELVDSAIKYYNRFIKPFKVYKTPLENEKNAITELYHKLNDFSDESASDEIQNAVFEIGKKYFQENLRAWFLCIYEVLFGQSEGPKIGSFIKIYGVKNFQNLIKKFVEIK